jgi:hypothetical protein
LAARAQVDSSNCGKYLRLPLLRIQDSNSFTTCF